MFRYLAALIWPLGMVIILGAAFLTSRRSQVAAAGPAGRHHSRRASSGSAVAGALSGSARVLIVAVAGAILTFGVMCLVGILVVHHGLAIDKPVFRWISTH